MGCIFDVFNEVGAGFEEPIYHQALGKRFEEERLAFRSKPHFLLSYRGAQIAELEPDYIIDDKIVLELKAIHTDFLPENFKQVISYLRVTNDRLGILVNLGLHEVFFKRVPFDQRPLKILEKIDEIVPWQSGCRDVLEELKTGIVRVGQELGLGYHAEVYQKAMKVELQYCKVSSDDHVKIPVSYHGASLGNQEIDYWLIDKKALFAVIAGSNAIRPYDVMRMRSYLKHLQLNVGLIAFWGKNCLEILGVGAKN